MIAHVPFTCHHCGWVVVPVGIPSASFADMVPLTTLQAIAAEKHNRREHKAEVAEIERLADRLARPDVVVQAEGPKLRLVRTLS